MARKHLLLVDADPRSLRVLEVSLRKAGYNLATCADADAALETVEYSTPDLILSDTRLPGKTGFELVETIKGRPELAGIPIMFLSSDTSVESKVKGLQLGVEDYLTKPIYIKEIVARINLTLSRNERESVARRSSISKTRFTGSLADMGLVDLLQTIEMSRKSGVLELKSHGASGMMTFRDGQILDAELGTIHGERAVYRLLLWSEGEFDIDFRPVRAEQQIQTPTQGLLMEGMRRLDEWGRLLEQIPPLASILEINGDELAARLSEIPDELNAILRLFDGHRALAEVLDLVEGDDLATLLSISKLYFEGIVQPTGKTRTLRPGSPDPGTAEAIASASSTGTVPAGDEASSEEPEGEEADVVPGGAQSMAPPPDLEADDRAEVDAERGTIPGHTSVVPPAMPPTAADLPEIAHAGTGTDDALPLVAQAAAGQIPLAQLGALRGGRVQTLIGPAFDAGPVGAATERGAGSHERGLEFGKAESYAASGSAEIGRPPDGGTPQGETESSDEGVMSKKKRRNRERAEREAEAKKAEAVAKPREEIRAEEVRAEEVVVKKDEAVKKDEVAAARKDDAASNVIQFPQKRASLAMAAGGEDATVEAPSARADETARRARDERDEEADDERDSDAGDRDSDGAGERSARPMPGEMPRVGGGAKNEPAAPPPSSRDRREERRRKKNETTSSSEMRAALGTGDHKAVTDDFFAKGKSQPPVHDDFSDLGRALEPIPTQSRQWMYGTGAIFCVFAIGIGAYWYYHNVHLPPEVELGHARPTTLPTAHDLHIPPPAADPPAADPDPSVEPALAAVDPAVEPAVDPALDPAADPSLAADPALDPGVEPVVEPAAEPAAEVAPPPPVVEPAVAEPGESYDSVLEEARAARGSRGIPLYERAVELNPNGVEALAQLSYLLVNRGRGDDMTRAAGFAERATSLDPTNALAWLVLGVARESMRPADRAGAREAYRSCVEFGTGRWVAECRPHAH